MKNICLVAILYLMIFFPSNSFAQTIDVLIKGIDDGVRTNKQQDFKEAEMNAKLQAIERAGLEVTSVTEVVNFQLRYDMIKTKAEAVLLPGFQVMDMGYQADGTYQVVLSGKVRSGGERVESKQIRYAINLFIRGRQSNAIEELDNIISTSSEDDVVASALYYSGVWNNDREVLEKLKSYYPNSKYKGLLVSHFKLKELEKKTRDEMEEEIGSRTKALNLDLNELNSQTIMTVFIDSDWINSRRGEKGYEDLLVRVFKGDEDLDSWGKYSFVDINTGEKHRGVDIFLVDRVYGSKNHSFVVPSNWIGDTLTFKISADAPRKYGLFIKFETIWKDSKEKKIVIRPGDRIKINANVISEKVQFEIFIKSDDKYNEYLENKRHYNKYVNEIKEQFEEQFQKNDIGEYVNL